MVGKVFGNSLGKESLIENKEDIIDHIDNMINLSEFYFYDEEYKRQIKRLKSLKKHIENDDFNKIFQKEGDDS